MRQAHAARNRLEVMHDLLSDETDPTSLVETIIRKCVPVFGDQPSRADDSLTPREGKQNWPHSRLANLASPWA